MGKTRSKRVVRAKTRRLRGGQRTPCTALKTTKLKKKSPDAQQDCLVSEAGIHHGAMLGCGEQGCAYSTVEEANKVVKITDFTAIPKANLPGKVSAWHTEACLGAHLGNLGIAPMIHRFFACEGRGYILMDRISDAKKIIVGGRPVQIRTRPDGKGSPPSDHLSLMPKEQQIGFMKQLAIMVENGYMHMDNHIENIGYKLDGTPILFDFGFTKERDFADKPRDKAWALAFSIFQILEHCELAEIEGTEFFRVASAIVAGKFEWPNRSFRTIGTQLAAVEGVSLAELKTLYPITTLSKLKTTASALVDDEVNLDVYVGSMIYAALVGLERTDRYDYKFYGTIYDIRQSKPF